MTDSASFDAPPDGKVRPQRQALERELQAMYVTHGPRIVGYFRVSGLSDAQASDLLQDVFILAYRKLDQFKGESLLSTWVQSIARNELIGHFRRRTRDSIDETSEPVDPDTLTVEVDPHLTAMHDCVRRGFARFAAEHPERAEPLYLLSVEQWTMEELAQHLGRTVNATKEYLSQCRARLRPYLKDCDEP